MPAEPIVLTPLSISAPTPRIVSLTLLNGAVNESFRFPEDKGDAGKFGEGANFEVFGDVNKFGGGSNAVPEDEDVRSDGNGAFFAFWSSTCCWEPETSGVAGVGE